MANPPIKAEITINIIPIGDTPYELIKTIKIPKEAIDIKNEPN